MTDLVPPVPARQVRARFDDATVTVYQAYSPAIAGPAVTAGTFVAPFSRTRMTWIKPSFFWMMYRSAWATSPGQERVLAVRLAREGFEAALAQAALSSHEQDAQPDRDAWRRTLRTSPVRVQWDPERGPRLERLEHRSLQVGLGPQVVPDYVDGWVVGIEDVTDLAHALRAGEPRDDVPVERPYPLPPHVAERIGASGA